VGSGIEYPVFDAPHLIQQLERVQPFTGSIAQEVDD
jgi:hypothetical protein